MRRSTSKSTSPPRPARRDPSPPANSPQTPRSLAFEPKLFVSGLPPHIQKEDIQGTFEKYGPISDCFIVNKDKFSFAFVLYQERKDAQKALKDIKSNETIIKDSAIRCEWAKPRKPNSDRKEGPRHSDNRSGTKGRQCYSCGKEGHLARECTNQASEDKKGQSDTKRPPRSSSKHEVTRKQDKDESPKKKNKKRDRRERSSSSSSSSSSEPRKSSNKRDREEETRKRKRNIKKRRESSSSSSSSSSEDDRRAKKNTRSRSKELRKGKKRAQSSSSSSSSN